MTAFNVIPAELRERPQWVLWKREERDGKATKVPYRADLRRRASATDSATWATFVEAVAAARAADGIGYVFTADDPYVGVDLDAGMSEADRGAIMLALGSYSEFSVSGQGVHVIVRANLNGYPRNRRGPFEVYSEGRYFVMTGQHVRGTPATIEDRQEQLEAVLERFLASPESGAAATFATQPADLDDQELLDHAMRAKNGAKFERLWNGDTTGYDSRSEADLALCSLLAFWTAHDPGRIDRLFRSSGLMRPKWERQDYAPRTITEAISRCKFAYAPRTRAQKSVGSVTKKPDFSTGTHDDGLTDSRSKESVSRESVPVRELQEDGKASDPESVEFVSDSGRPFALPIHEFIKLEREHREPLLADVDGRAVVGRNSLTLLGALGGHGKTTWAIDVFLHLAAGIDYPPWTVPRPVAILLIENEGPEELFAEKLEGRLTGFPHELQARLDVCTFDWGGFSLSGPSARTRLMREIADKSYDLVFGDPLDSLGIEGVGSPEDTRKFLGLMKETGLNKTVAWWLNTHPRKEETKEALNEISGAWGGKPDSVFLLKMLADDRTRIRQPKLRWAKRGKGPTLLMAFDAETEAFTFVGEESEEERDYVAEIDGLLADGEWRIVKEIAAPKADGGIGAGDATVKKVLEEHPERFASRTGEEAKALGRSMRAIVWQLVAPPPFEGAEEQ